MPRETNARGRGGMPTLSLRLAFLLDFILVAVAWIGSSAALNTTGTLPLGSQLPDAAFNERTGRRIGSRPVNEMFGEVPERGQSFLQCSRKRVTSRSGDHDQGLKNCPNLDGSQTFARGTSLGRCGKVYFLGPGDSVKVKFPSKGPTCEIFIWAVEGASLVLQCPKFLLGREEDEYLFISDGHSLGETFSGSQGPGKLKGALQFVPALLPKVATRDQERQSRVQNQRKT
ncbi:hypothetical protein O3P69_010653 [Scylla paramamosain]|uniref:Uncharacterized protein n=1 Tax=Scylla paramamosain TaxID=85552 RepID=A0AAW0TFK2_SCYPA